MKKKVHFIKFKQEINQFSEENIKEMFDYFVESDNTYIACEDVEVVIRDIIK